MLAHYFSKSKQNMVITAMYNLDFFMLTVSGGKLTVVTLVNLGWVSTVPTFSSVFCGYSISLGSWKYKCVTPSLGKT